MGVDPISLIVAALLAGAAAGATKVAGQAVVDAYATLKQLLQRRFADKPAAQMVLNELETAPQVWEAPLRKSLEDIDAARDDELVAAAQRLRDRLAESEPNPAPGSVVVRDASLVALSGGRVANIDIAGAAGGSAIVAAAGDVSGPVSASSAANTDEVRRLFDEILAQVRRRPADPDVDNREIQSEVEQVRDEAARGRYANPNKLHRWLRTLREVAPDVAQAVAAVLRQPELGLPEEARTALDQSTGADAPTAP
jgi:hypothetical protein